jgi:chromosome segregation ATPase
MGITVELKGAQTRLDRNRAELRFLEQEKSDVAQRIVVVRARIASIEEEVRKLKGTISVIVSEHAMLRYLERIMRIDMDDVRRKILEPGVVQAISHFHSGNIPHPDGFSVRARENVVTTVINDGDDW